MINIKKLLVLLVILLTLVMSGCNKPDGKPEYDYSSCVYTEVNPQTGSVYSATMYDVIATNTIDGLILSSELNGLEWNYEDNAGNITCYE